MRMAFGPPMSMSEKLMHLWREIITFCCCGKSQKMCFLPKVGRPRVIWSQWTRHKKMLNESVGSFDAHYWMEWMLEGVPTGSSSFHVTRGGFWINPSLQSLAACHSCSDKGMWGSQRNNDLWTWPIPKKSRDHDAYPYCDQTIVSLFNLTSQSLEFETVLKPQEPLFLL